jgi:hypothetical protein
MVVCHIWEVRVYRGQVRWLTPVILATWETEIGRIKAGGQPGQIVHETPSPNGMQMGAKWTGGVVQAVECLPEFKSQSYQKKKKAARA